MGSSAPCTIVNINWASERWPRACRRAVHDTRLGDIKRAEHLRSLSRSPKPLILRRQMDLQMSRGRRIDWGARSVGGLEPLC